MVNHVMYPDLFVFLGVLVHITPTIFGWEKGKVYNQGLMAPEEKTFIQGMYMYVVMTSLYCTGGGCMN